MTPIDLTDTKLQERAFFKVSSLEEVCSESLQLRPTCVQSRKERLTLNFDRGASARGTEQNCVSYASCTEKG